jgi:hypothetical protein
MSSDQIQSEDRRQIALPPLDIAISERAWVKRELEFWHRCTIEDYTDAGVIVSLDNMEELTVASDCVSQFELEPNDLVFVRYWEGAGPGHPGLVREGALSGYPGFVRWVDGETVEIEYPAEFYRKTERYLHLQRDLRVYADLEPAQWPKGSRVFAYKIRHFDPPLFLFFPAVVQETHYDVCVEVEFDDGETAFVPTTLVQSFEVNPGDIVYTCTSYISHGINPDEQWSLCRVLSRDGDTLLLHDGAGERFEVPAGMIAVLPKGYEMKGGNLTPIAQDARGSAPSAVPPAMAGDVHIVRTDDWRHAALDPITKAQVDELIAADPELAWSIAGSPNGHSDPREAHPREAPRYVSILWNGQPCFWWYQSEIRCTKPSDEQLAKMIEIAVVLDANVVGENGEEYH